ncbi:MAG: HAMP domain-containing histidine kinase [Planctomycetes bacterium]|nr:HAMP domain-containing histidine kinase [Planctomycetota bacterium]
MNLAPRHCDMEVAQLLSHWPIRYKMLIGIALLLVIVGTLSASGFHGVYSYRRLVKSVSQRAGELPLATELSRHVSDLRSTLSQVQGIRMQPFGLAGNDATSVGLREQFRMHFQSVQDTVARYRQRLDTNEPQQSNIGDATGERRTLAKIEATLERIAQVDRDEDWLFDAVRTDELAVELKYLQELSVELPSHLHERLRTQPAQVRLQYRALIVVTWVSSIASGLLVVLLLKLGHSWVFRPLRVLIRGSRRVAAGEFDHRIELETSDEMSELAAAMNGMTERFQAIRNDLDNQVQQRTDQVMRSEKLASLGFLAAGVAHEINNPLASIAMCAESLESRLAEIVSADDPQHAVVDKYLKMIQSEAFRCKDITERLLDFARSGDVERQPTELRSLVRGVIDMVAPLDKYQDKQIRLASGEKVVAAVAAQEIKQVVLNLLTNALDSLEPGGRVDVEVTQTGETAELIFTDDGCGMSDEVLEQLFEPFFTHSKTGEGTGLGLSIAFQIVRQHNGEIIASSDGPGQGSRFRVRLALAGENKESQHHYRAA